MAQNIKKTHGIIEKPARIGEDVTSLTASEKANKIRQSAIEDILKTVVARDNEVKEQGPEAKNTFKKPI